MNYSLKELLDVPRLREQLDALDELHSMPSAIIDTEGNVLTATAWQEICTRFHRVNSDTEKMCIESDRHIEARLGERQPHVLYKCPMGLVDSAMPIIIEGKHLGNVFTGQLFMEAPDEAYFINQAHTYGFDEVEYLDAMRRVPFFTEEKLHKNLNFIHGLAQMLAEQGLQNKRLQESQDKHSTILLTSTSGFLLADMQGQIMEVNAAYCQMSGFSEQELLTMRIPDLEALERPEDTANRIRKIMETGQDHFESIHRRKDGSEFVVEVSTQYQPFDGGQCVAFLRDITEIKHGESLLHARISLSEYALTHSLKDLLTKTLDDVETLTKSMIGFFHFLDTDQQTLILQAWSSNTLSTMCNAEVGGEHYSIDKAGVWVDCVRMRKPVIHNDYATLPHRKGMPQGHATVVRELVVPIFRGDLIVGIIGVGNKPHDYTEKDIETVMTLGNLVWDIVVGKLAENALRDSEAALRESELKYRSLADSGQLLIWTSDTDKLCDYFNKVWLDFTGRIFAQEYGNGWMEGVHPDDLQSCLDIYVSAFDKREAFSMEYRLRRHDGEYRWLQDDGCPRYSSNGDFIGYIGYCLDITERKQAEDKRLEVEEKFRRNLVLLQSVINHFPGVVFWKDTESIYLGCNKNFSDAAGLTSPDEIVGKSDFDLPWAETEATDYREIDRRVMDSCAAELHIIETQHQADGKVTWFDTSKVPIIDKEGAVMGILGASFDISEIKRVEEERMQLELQFQQTQKLESLGVLSSGIAHDFNNILAIIIGYCGLTKLNYQTAEKNIPIIETAAERAAGLCRQMMAYAGKAQLTMTRINIVRKVEEMVGMLKATLPQNTVIKTDLSAEIPLIEGDASQLRQVIMNLIINSSEAIGTEQGVVDVSLAMVKIMAGKAYKDYHGKQIPPGEYVCLEVTDNGCGMDEETKWRIFEPFYTTKFAGRGLGMSAVLGIIKSHGERCSSSANRVRAQPSRYISPPLKVRLQEMKIKQHPHLSRHGGEVALYCLQRMKT